MKKTYEQPTLLLLQSDERDVITTSSGDTPNVDVFDW